MKRIGAVILALFYLLYTSGVTIYQHYCMGELASVSVFHTGDKECSKCGMKQHTAKSKGCCKDVAVNVKSNESHIFSSVIPGIDFSSYIHFPQPAFIFLTSEFVKEPVFHALHLAHAPPLSIQPLFIQYQNFRI